MGLANPLLIPLFPTTTVPTAEEEEAKAGVAGATTPILSSSKLEGDEARIAAALSSTEGTL